MPLAKKKLIVYFPDDWEDSNIHLVQILFETITTLLGFDGISYHIRKLGKEDES